MGRYFLDLAAMKILLVAALCATALAVPNERRLRPEEHWRPAAPRDITKYRPRGELFSDGAAAQDFKRIKSLPKRMPGMRKPSAYDLDVECGIEGPPSKSRIVGGEEAEPNQWPWIVALFIDNSYFCGGSLITENFVMTAAHCVDGAFEFDVMAGAHDIREYYEDTRIEITSFFGFTHEDWDPERLANDIALISLPYPISFNSYIRPACLPNPGDSGGPLNIRTGERKWNQVGIVSFGSSRGCEVGIPAAFTRTEYYLDWINIWI